VSFVRRRPQVVAWSVLLTGLLTFCLLAAGTGYGLYYFLFKSSVPLSVRLVVSRGSVKLQTLDASNPLVDTSWKIEPHTTIDIRDDSQAILYFDDPYSKKNVTAITLTKGTRLRVQQATRPRFEFSGHPYQVNLDNADGQLIITATPENRAYLANIYSGMGVAQLLDDGRYTVSTEYYPETDLRRLNLFNQGGAAKLYKLNNFNDWKEPYPNSIAHIANGEFELNSESPLKILAEGRFVSDEPVKPGDVPQGWKCQNSADPREPLGETKRDASAVGAPYAMRFTRIGPEPRIKNGRSSCFLQNLAVDTSGYSSFRLHVRLNIQYQDLTLCGVKASECPIMLEVRYDILGVSENHRWNHGFYLTSDASKPSSCATCRQDHEKINPNVWYFYDSGDLRPQFDDPGGAALIIREIVVYASGHQYDALVSEVTLLGTP